MIDHLSSLTQHLLEFGRYLRARGFGTTTHHIQESLTLLDRSSLRNAASMRLLLRSTLCHNWSEYSSFDGHFAAYWNERFRGEQSKIQHKEGDKARQNSKPAATLQQLKDWLHGSHQLETIAAETYSLAPAIEDRDFAELSEDEINNIIRMLRKVARRWQARKSRRYQRSRQMDRFDHRLTIRSALSSQAEILRYYYRSRKRRKYRLVVIGDVSRSMQLYSRFVLHFMIALSSLFRDLEAFTFSRDLNRITDKLPRQHHDPEDLRSMLSDLVTGSGGTEIGRSLKTYLDTFARGQLSRNSKVIIISDGWDLGQSDLIEETMYRIQRMCRQVIWINPLKGQPGYTPEVKGMKAALPYIDHFASCHNLQTLEALVPVLFSHR